MKREDFSSFFKPFAEIKLSDITATAGKRHDAASASRLRRHHARAERLLPSFIRTAQKVFAVSRRRISFEAPIA